MKIILSRKGFDSSAGGKPSPIFEDGRLFSLPIPEEPGRSSVRYADLRFCGVEISALVESLTGLRVKAGSSCHLDPDLERRAIPERPRGWRPAFGQTMAALNHLDRQKVGAGDLFLFFGWFRRVEPIGKGRWRYVAAAPDVHQLFGWLQIGRSIDVTTEEFPYPGLAQHAHLHPRFMDGKNGPNRVYVAAKRLSLAGRNLKLPGAGCFPKSCAALELTEPGQKRSLWRLPGWFFPRDGKPALTYHCDPRRWRRQGDDAILRSAGRGQEFVFDTQFAPEAISWLVELFGHA